MLTYKQKVNLYSRGQYLFPPPPVCTTMWDRSCWIAYIDRCGGWITPESRLYNMHRQNQEIINFYVNSLEKSQYKVISHE